MMKLTIDLVEISLSNIETKNCHNVYEIGTRAGHIPISTMTIGTAKQECRLCFLTVQIVGGLLKKQLHEVFWGEFINFALLLAPRVIAEDRQEHPTPRIPLSVRPSVTEKDRIVLANTYTMRT